MSLKTTLLDALNILHCDTSAYSFDDSSTISMSFNDVGDILIDPVDGQVWFWGSLPEMPAEALRGSAFELMEVLSSPLEFMTGGCLCMRADGDVRVVGGLVRPDYLEEPRYLAAVVEGFYLRMVQLRNIVK